MGLGRKPSPPGHRVLYSAVEKVSQEGPELSKLLWNRTGRETQGKPRRNPGETGHGDGD